MAPENADMADAFICFIGECFIKFAGAEWVEFDWFGRENSFYDHVNPALLMDTYLPRQRKRIRPAVPYI